MKTRLLKITAFVLAATMLLSVGIAGSASELFSKGENLYKYLTNPDVDPDECSNSIIIPGVFQSDVMLYNDDGSVACNSEGEEYLKPFYLDASNDIVKKALSKCLVPLLLTLFTQHDWNGWLSDSVSSVLGEALGEKVKSDAKGNMVYNVKADKYPGSVAECTPEQRKYILNQIPLDDYATICGSDHLYFYSYCSFGNLDSMVDELYALIKNAAADSPTGKVNIVPISQGGTLANNLLERYPEVGEYLDRIVYIVPALDGTVLLGEIYEKGIIDDDEAIYHEMFPLLLNEDDNQWMGSLVNILIRVLPKETVNAILDKAVDTLINDYIKYSTAMWALVPQANYPGAAEKYLSGEQDAFIRQQTDNYYKAQQNSDANILYQIETYGVEVFDIADYNYTLYPIVDSWKKLNGDGVIHVDSTSMGATSFGVDVELPADYVPAFDGKYVDPYNIIDGGTGLLPDTTFYFHNQDHETSSRNDVIMKLAICLLIDKDFVSVESYPEKFPQFNEVRDGKSFEKDVRSMLDYDTSTLSEEDAAELAAAIAQAQEQLDNTVADPDDFNAARNRFDNIRYKILGVTHEPTSEEIAKDIENDILTYFIVMFSNIIYNVFGGRNF